MKATWLKQNEGGRLTLFFNGWGQDATVVGHLKSDDSVLMINDYRSLECDWPDLSAYSEVRLVAWSMGVWAAANTVSHLEEKITTSIAYCGTERPIDDNFGIPLRIHKVNLCGMQRHGTERFNVRMFQREEERLFYGDQLSSRPLNEMIEELRCIGIQSQTCCASRQWTKAIVPRGDMIIPTDIQKRYWKGRTQIVERVGGHCLFARYHEWDELFEGKRKQ